MSEKSLKGMMLCLVCGAITCSTVHAENIDPNNNGSQYAWGENVGWLNAEPLGEGGPGVQVEELKLTGYIWAENIGWISLSCENTSSCSQVDYGLTNDGAGVLTGYAWGENVGWINLGLFQRLGVGRERRLDSFPLYRAFPVQGPDLVGAILADADLHR